MIIKLLLFAALAGAGYLLVHGRQSALSLLIRRVLALSAIGVGMVAVILPNETTHVANLVGVGRGADLVLYLLCVTFLFTTIGLHLRLAQLHDRYVELARQIAIQNAVLERDAGQASSPLT